MSLALSPNAVEAYSSRASRQITNSFFENREFASGQDLVKASSSEQVNFFILRQLFEKWQQEMATLTQSPYFDYEAEPVQTTLKQFMNLLSRNIKVEPDAFYGLTEEAVAATIRLAFDAREYLSSEVEALPDEALTTDKLKELNRYIRLNKGVWQSTIERTKQESQPINRDTLLTVLTEESRNATAEFDNLIAVLNKIEAVEARDLIEDNPLAFADLEPAPVLSEELHETDFFGDLDMMTEPETPATPQNIPPPVSSPATPQEPAPVHATIATVNVQTEEPSQQRPVQPIAATTTPEPVHKMPETQTTTPQIIPDYDVADRVRKAMRKDDYSPKEAIHDIEPASQHQPVYERYAQEKPTLHDQLRSQTETATASLNDRLASNQKIQSLKHSFSINEKFMFINELFEGDNIGWSMALKDLDDAPDRQTALQLIETEYAPKYRWDMNNERVHTFVETVKKRF